MNGFLLDTHAALWWLMDSPRLSTAARAVIGDPDSTLLVSAVSAYEVAYKQGLGKLPADVPEIEHALRQQGIGTLSVTMAHMAAAGRLPGPHRDPWDRIIMAQAVAEGLTVITVDPVFAAYGVPCLR